MTGLDRFLYVSGGLIALGFVWSSWSEPPGGSAASSVPAPSPVSQAAPPPRAPAPTALVGDAGAALGTSTRALSPIFDFGQAEFERRLDVELIRFGGRSATRGSCSEGERRVCNYKAGTIGFVVTTEKARPNRIVDWMVVFGAGSQAADMTAAVLASVAAAEPMAAEAARDVLKALASALDGGPAGAVRIGDTRFGFARLASLGFVTTVSRS